MNPDTSRSARVGLFFLFGIALLWIVYDTFTAKSAFDENSYTIRAPFEDVKQLKVGSDVRLAGVSIGSIGDLKLEEGQAMAVLQIEKIHKIPADSLATITTAGLLGNNYVSIQVGVLREYLKENDAIRTKEGADVNKILEQIGEIGKRVTAFLDDVSGTGNGSLLGGLTGMMDEARPKINGVLDNMMEITNHVASGKGSAGKLIYDDAVYGQLLSVVDSVKKAAADAESFFKDARAIVNKISAESDGPLSFILHNKNATIQLKDSIANVQEFTKNLNNKDSTLGRLMNSDDLYVQAENILNKVNNAIEGVENSGPMTAVGISASALF